VNNALRVYHHDTSTMGLHQEEANALRKCLIPRNIDVTIEPYIAKPRKGLPPASIIEPLTLVLVIAGSLAAKTLLQEVVKDLYAYFKTHLKDLKKRNPQVNIAVGIEVHCEGNDYDIGVSFQDERSLEIAFYRTSVEMQKHTQHSGKFTLMLLKEPEAPGFIHIATATGTSVVAGGLLFAVGNHISILRGWPTAVLILAALCAIWLFIVGIPWYRWRRYISKFGAQARIWASNIQAGSLGSSESG
jgi:hypothetical protein